MTDSQLFTDPVQPDRGLLELTAFDMVGTRKKRGRPISRAAQARLFGTTRQKRNRDWEREAVYCAVLALRRKGLRVYRIGNTGHMVDGMLVTVGQLKKMAEAK